MQYHERERLERWLADVRTRRRSVRPAEAHRVLLSAGFERRFGKGDHWVYSQPGRPRLITIDPRSPLLPAYVSEIIIAIEELLNA